MDEKLQLLLKLNDFSHKLLRELKNCSKSSDDFEKLKLRVEVNGIKHRLLIDQQQHSNRITFDEFRNAVCNSCQQFEQYFDGSQYFFEIFDPDFEEFIKLEETDSIEDKSKLRVVRIGSPGSQRSTQTLRVQSAVNENVDSFESTSSSQLNCDVDNNASQVPLLPAKCHAQIEREESVEHTLSSTVNSSNSEPNLLVARNSDITERSLSLTYGGSNNQISYSGLKEELGSNTCSEICRTDSGESSSKEDLRCPLQEIDNNVRPVGSQISMHVAPRVQHETGKQSESPPPVLFADEHAHQYIGKQTIPVSNFIIRNFNKKRALAASVRKHTKLFVKQSQHSSSVWKKVSQTLVSIEVNFSAEECRHYFSGLLGQYICILKNLMELNVEEAQTVWPLFKMFHFSFNLKPFKSDILALRELFNNYSKAQEVCHTQASAALHAATVSDAYLESFTKTSVEYDAWDPWKNDFPPLSDEWPNVRKARSDW